MPPRLSDEQFGNYYHGSNTQFQPGDTLRTPSETGNTYWGNIHGEDMHRVYSVGSREIDTLRAQERMEDHGLYGLAESSESPDTKAERLAWTFATQRVGFEPEKRGAVYKVQPSKDVAEPYNPDIPGEVISKSAGVKERIDTMPGRQGTFPQINWNQFATHLGKEAPAPHNYPDEYDPDMVTLDYNHPPDVIPDDYSGFREDDRRAALVGREPARKANKEMQDRIQVRENALYDKAQGRLF